MRVVAALGVAVAIGVSAAFGMATAHGVAAACKFGPVAAAPQKPMAWPQPTD